MPFFHSIRRFLKKSNGKAEENNLLGEPTDEDHGLLNYNYINKAHLKENNDSLDSGHSDKIFPILKHLFNKDLRYCEVSEQVTQLISNNVMKPTKNDGCFTPSENWLKKYHKLVDDNLDMRFLTRPKECKECLKEATDLMCNLSCLVPVLEHLGILAYVVDSFNCRLFAMLDDLMERCVLVTDAKLLLHWVTQQYFRQDHKADTNKNVLFKISDPLVLTSWYEKSKQKALHLIQSYISSTLQNILHNEKVDVNRNYNNDEAFNRIHIDVIQCLNETIQSSTAISQTLGNTVQRLCCDELHSFVVKFMIAEKNYLQKSKKIKKIHQDYLLNCFRIVNTCRQLRVYAEVITDLNNTDSLTISLLTDMQKQAISNIQGCWENITEKYIGKYFYKEKEEYKNKLISTIETTFKQMSQIKEMNEEKQCIVKEAYQSVTKTYLRFMLKRKYKQLKKTWNELEKRVMRDAECFHSVFKKNGYEEQEMLLLKISEILLCGEKDSLKLLCTNLITHFPIESETYLADVLYWRGNLSNRQIKEVLNVSWDVVYGRQNSQKFPMYLSCCICSS